MPNAFPAHLLLLLLLHVPEQLPLLSPDRRWSSTTPRLVPASAFLGQAVLMEAQTLVQGKEVFSCPGHLLLIMSSDLELTNTRAFMVYVEQAKR